MNVTLYAYHLVEKKVKEKDVLDVELFEKDFVDCIKSLCCRKQIDRKYRLDNTKKVIYLDKFKYNESNHTIFLVFKSAEFGKARKVVDTDTLEEQPGKKKGKRDGDEETTCAVIKFDKDEKSKNAVCLLQVNSNGVTLNRIFEYLNIEIGAIHSALGDKIKYNVKYTNIVSHDFLNALEKAGRIRTVKLVIDSDASGDSDFKKYANDNDDVAVNFDIIYKPAKAKNGISKDTVKKFFDKYKKEGADIKKIWVDTSKSDGNPLSFDTEKMKEKEHIVVTDTINNEPKIDELEVQMLQIIKRY